MSISETDLLHLRRCVELAGEALAGGHQPFGSVLVGGDGAVLLEARNETGGGDQTRHPELDLVLWSVDHLDADGRAAATTYTSGEHCPMCSAAHAWMGLGRLVYAVSSAQLSGWLKEWGAAPSPVAALPVQQVAPGVVVDGPAPSLVEQMKALHRRAQDRPTTT